MTGALMVIALSLGVSALPVCMVHETTGHAMAGLSVLLGAVFVWAAWQETKLRAFHARIVVDVDADWRAARRCVACALLSDAVVAPAEQTSAHRRRRSTTTLKEAA